MNIYEETRLIQDEVERWSQEHRQCLDPQDRAYWDLVDRIRALMAGTRQRVADAFTAKRSKLIGPVS